MNRFTKRMIAILLVLVGGSAIQLEAQAYNSAPPAIVLCNKCEGQRFCVPCGGTGLYSKNPCAICVGSGLCYYCNGTGRF